MRKSILAIIILFIWAGSALAALPLPINTGTTLVIDRTNGNYLKINDIGSIFIQEPSSFKVNLLFHAHGNDITLASNTNIGDTVITLNPGHGATVGKFVGLKEGVRFYDGEIVGVNVNDITLDSPLDFAFTTATDLAHIHDPDMNVDGSTTTQVFHITPAAGSQWEITRIICVIEDNAVMDSGKFGGIAALTNGMLLRIINGTYQNIWNVKTNGDFSITSFDLEYDPKAPAGVYGFRTRSTFGGIDKRGSIFYLDGDEGDELQILIQDDTTGLIKFRCMGQGRVKGND